VAVTFIRLVKRLARTPSSCAFCAWVSDDLDPVWAPVVSGVELARYCSQRCAAFGGQERGQGRMEAF